MTDFFVTYTMANKEDRDGYLREIQEKGIDELSRGEEGCYRYDYFYPVGKDNMLFLWEQWETELKKKYGVTADIQIEDR